MMAAWVAGHPGHRHQVLSCHRRHVDVLRQAAGQLVAESLAVAADVLVALAACCTHAARDEGVHGHLVAHGDPVGQRPVGIDDGSRELVSEHRGKRDVALLAALEDPNVGAAQECCVDAEQDVARFEAGHRNLFDPHIVRPVQHGLTEASAVDDATGIRGVARC